MERRTFKKTYCCFIFAVILLHSFETIKSQDLIVWGETIPLEGEVNASWARMVKLKNGVWLAAYAVFGNSSGSRIRVKKSSDNMRTWRLLTEFGEAGRQLDNANLLKLSNGEILLSMRSLIDRKSYRVQVYKSKDQGRNFKFLSVIDSNESPNETNNSGVWESFLTELSPNKIAVFYASEKYSKDTPSFSQIISERISQDNGASWGAEIRAVAEAGKSRPGEPNLLRLENDKFILFYEVCGSENCTGHYSISSDGKVWDGKIGPEIPNIFQNPQALALDNKTFLVTSNNARIIYSRDGGISWKLNSPAFDTSAWGALYQTGKAEIAIVTGTKMTPKGRNQLIIRLGKIVKFNK